MKKIIILSTMIVLSVGTIFSMNEPVSFHNVQFSFMKPQIDRISIPVQCKQGETRWACSADDLKKAAVKYLAENYQIFSDVSGIRLLFAGRSLPDDMRIDDIDYYTKQGPFLVIIK